MKWYEILMAVAVACLIVAAVVLGVQVKQQEQQSAEPEYGTRTSFALTGAPAGIYRTPGGAAEVFPTGTTLEAESGSLVQIDSGATFTVDTIAETTAANGVTVDGLAIKDSGITVSGALALSAGTQVTVTDNCTITMTAPQQVVVSAANVGITNVVPSGVGLFAIRNAGSYTVTFTETGSIFTSGGNVVLPPEGLVVAYYDGTTAWGWIDKDN